MYIGWKTRENLDGDTSIVADYCTYCAKCSNKANHYQITATRESVTIHQHLCNSHFAIREEIGQTAFDDIDFDDPESLFDAIVDLDFDGDILDVI